MAKKIILLSLLAIFKFNTSFCQFGYDMQAIRFSQAMPTGSARIVALGGSGVALGADIGSIYINPAGIGLFRKNEISISPNMGIGASSSSVGNASFKDSQLNFNIGNGGGVFSFMKDPNTESDWRGINIGISVTRTNDFQNLMNYQVNNSPNSLSDDMRQRANGIPFSVYDNEYSKNQITSLPSLGYATFLINPNTNSNNYFQYLPNTVNIRIRESQKFEGSTYQTGFALAGNYKDKLYIGFSANLMTTRYDVTKTYTEQLMNGGNGYFSNFTLKETLKTEGAGINLNFGFIYKVKDWLRFGGSIMTPTVLFLTEKYNAELNANFNKVILSGGGELNNASAKSLSQFQYAAITPARFNFGTSIFLNKYGFFTLDAEYVDYKSITLLSNNSSSTLSADNQSIENKGNRAFNIRTGIEARVDVLRFRVGAAYYSPFTDPNTTINNESIVYSAGLGYRGKNFFCDLAYMRKAYNRGYTPYTLNPESSIPNLGNPPFVNTNYVFSNLLLTLGFSF